MCKNKTIIGDSLTDYFECFYSIIFYFSLVYFTISNNFSKKYSLFFLFLFDDITPFFSNIPMYLKALAFGILENFIKSLLWKTGIIKSVSKILILNCDLVSLVILCFRSEEHTSELQSH